MGKKCIGITKENVIISHLRKDRGMDSRENKINNLIFFLKKMFPNGIQMFCTRNICGDPMVNIYDSNDISVDYCHYYSYIEIFGLEDDEFERVLVEAKGY
jgi:hypothetical protein